MKAVVAAFNQDKALVRAFSVITNFRMDLFEALVDTSHVKQRADSADIVRVTVSIIVQRFMGMKMSNT